MNPPTHDLSGLGSRERNSATPKAHRSEGAGATESKTRLHSALRTLHSAFGPELLASFGEARLVKHLSGKIELLGGSPDDRRAAKEWCSLFMHEAVIGGPDDRRPCRDLV